jgi:hypothetical protein
MSKKKWVLSPFHHEIPENPYPLSPPPKCLCPPSFLSRTMGGKSVALGLAEKTVVSRYWCLRLAYFEFRLASDARTDGRTLFS